MYWWGKASVGICRISKREYNEDYIIRKCNDDKKAFAKCTKLGSVTNRGKLKSVGTNQKLVIRRIYSVIRRIFNKKILIVV